jgi:glycosyltransferase involved in cell wall biosynthesis
MAGVSILILTLNEERDLPGCLQSVAWSDDVVVLDSMSTDRTEAVARAGKARFFQRRFDNYSAHRNWALRHIEYTNPWLFVLDADERMTPELQREIRAIAAGNGDPSIVAYRVRFKNMLWGRWIKRASLYPTWVTRFVQPAHVRYEDRPVHAHLMVDGAHGRLQSHFLHFGFSKGVAHWFDRHNRYSSMEADACLRELRTGKVDWKGLRSVDPGTKRRALKNFSFRLPLRPVVKFIYYYIVRGAILEGEAGLTYCVLQSIYEYMIVLKLREIRRRELGLPL